MRLGIRELVVYLGILLCVCSASLAQEVMAVPQSAAEAAQLLEREPFTLQSWPVWKPRLLSWIKDRGKKTDKIFQAAREFALSQYNNRQLPPALNNDFLAWYLVGRGLMDKVRANPAESAETIQQAEFASKRSLQLQPQFAQNNRNLAMLLILQAGITKGQVNMREFEEHRRRVAELLPKADALLLSALLAAQQNRHADAVNFFAEAMREEPESEGMALGYAQAVVSHQEGANKAQAIQAVCAKFPESGELVCYHGLALAMEEKMAAAVKEFERAEKLGTRPEQVFSPELVQAIRADAQPSLFERIKFFSFAFLITYAILIPLMALGGFILATQTRGANALMLLGSDPHEAIMAGQIVRTRQESLLATLYAFALFAGLVMFYISVPFVVVGLLAITGLALLAIFQLGRIPIKLVVVVVVVGLGMVWSVLKSVFSGPGSGSFGVPKKREEHPKLYGALEEVARRIDTSPVDEVYIAPGASIGVHQEGRGPFGIFGVKKRVLTLGLSTMHFLTISELKAILSHEYAHFSHKDTFYSRFIYQVQSSIENALNGMASAGGWVNYVNPFYWFFYLYYKAYTLLSSGYSRSREFLADRMAASLYGADVFGSALKKVCTDGQLFEATMYDHISELLGQEKGFVNMYEVFRSVRNDHIEQEEREKLYTKLLNEKSSLFASHPTYEERIQALAGSPNAVNIESASAMQLFDQPEELEKEMTDFLTAFLYHVKQAQLAAD